MIRVRRPNGVMITPSLWVEPAHATDTARWLWIEVEEDDWKPIFLSTDDIAALVKELGR